MKFTKQQFQRASEIVGNTSVAWFSAGIISPVFVRPLNFNLIFSFFVAASLSAISFLVSIKLAKH